MHPTGAGFVKRGGRTLCGTCAAADRQRRAGRQGLLVWGLFGATALAWWLDAPPALSSFLNGLSLFYAVGVCLTAIHEAGHALAALFLGVRVRGIQLGAEGPPVLSFVGEKFTFRVLLLPLGGKTFVAPATKAVRSRHLVIAAAGPLTELGVLLAAWQWEPAGAFATNVREDILIIGVLSLLLNLVVPLRQHRNDAWAMVELLRMGRSQADAIAGIDAHDELARRLNAHTRGEPMTVDELEECRQAFLERWRHPGLDERGRAVAANNLASVDQLLDRPELLDEADEMSQYAYEWLPVPAVIATRGAVLLQLGRPKEGVELMRRALPGLDPADAGQTLASLCLGALSVGNVFEARRWFAALGSHPEVPAFESVVAQLGPAELGNVLRWYWTPERTPEEAAAALVADDRQHARLIAANIARYLETASAPEVSALMQEHGWDEMPPEEAPGRVGRLVAALAAGAG